MQQFIEGFNSFFNGTAGRVVSAAIALVLVMAIAGWFFKKTSSPKILVYMAMCLALASVLSVFKLFPGWLQGGSITLCSMLFVSLIGYFFGPSAGIIGGITYGFIQFTIGPSTIIHPVQLFMDYPLAFAALGLSGFLHNKKFGLCTGFIFGALIRGVIHTISGVIFYSEYAKAANKNVWIYSSEYNFSYIIPEMILTCAIIAIPVVYKSFGRIKSTAVR